MRLRQVLLNLISNAIKFTPEGTVTVVAQSPWRQDDDIGLHVQVRDTGIGIPADRLDKIFESFTQVDASTTRRFGGTGLGLTITAELVRLMQGRIWVQSSDGAGSVFHVAIPLKQGTPPAITDASHESAPRNMPPAHPSHPLRVLVADDHEPNRQLVTTILSKRGHQCVEAATGQEAIEIAQHGTARCGADGHSDAGRRRIRRYGGHSSNRTGNWRPLADHRADRTRHAWRRGQVPRGRHGRVPG